MIYALHGDLCLAYAVEMHDEEGYSSVEDLLKGRGLLQGVNITTQEARKVLDDSNKDSHIDTSTEHGKAVASALVGFAEEKFPEYWSEYEE